jgi:hypothetical protein
MEADAQSQHVGQPVPPSQPFRPGIRAQTGPQSADDPRDRQRGVGQCENDQRQAIDME